MVYYILYLSEANRQDSCYKVSIYTDEKRFLKEAWHLKGYIYYGLIAQKTLCHPLNVCSSTK